MMIYGFSIGMMIVGGWMTATGMKGIKEAHKKREKEFREEMMNKNIKIESLI